MAEPTTEGGDVDFDDEKNVSDLKDSTLAARPGVAVPLDNQDVDPISYFNL